MARLYYRHGAMNSGKSFEILKVAHNYEEQNKDVVIFTSAVDDRASVGVVATRVAGMEREAIPLDDTSNAFEIVQAMEERPYCVLVDEAQFLSRDHILQFTQIVDDLAIPVIAYGLKNDFTNNLFEGSKNLLLYADKIEEVKTICWFCHRKAMMNLRLLNGRPIYEGEQIQIGGNESYYPVCRRCYMTAEEKVAQMNEERI